MDIRFGRSALCYLQSYYSYFVVSRNIAYHQQIHSAPVFPVLMILETIDLHFHFKHIHSVLSIIVMDEP